MKPISSLLVLAAVLGLTPVCALHAETTTSAASTTEIFISEPLVVLIGNEFFNKPARFPLQNAPATHAEMFKLLAEGVNLSYVYRLEDMSGQKVVSPPASTIGVLIEEILRAETLRAESNTSGLVWLLPERQAVATAAARAAARKEARELIGESEYNRLINVTVPPGTNGYEMLSLLSKRANLNLTVPAGGVQKLAVDIRQKPLGAAIIAFMEVLNLRMRGDGKGGLVAEPLK